MSQTERQKVGELGENIAAHFLVNKGYSVVERNYRRPWGEIDIVAIKDKVLHFVEVKAMSQCGGGESSVFLPEDHMGFHKIRRLKRAMETYLVDRYKEGTEPQWQLDLVAIDLDTETKKAKVRFVEGIEIDG